MEKEKDRAAYWLRAFLWLILFIIFGILDGFVQEKFPEFLLPHYLQHYVSAHGSYLPIIAFSLKS